MASDLFQKQHFASLTRTKQKLDWGFYSPNSSAPSLPFAAEMPHNAEKAAQATVFQLLSIATMP